MKVADDATSGVPAAARLLHYRNDLNAARTSAAKS